jgi:hypothetical protein
MSTNLNQTEQNVRRILSAARELAPEPSPYLKTRVLAQLRERRQAGRLKIWKTLAFLSPVASMLVVAGFWFAGLQGAAYSAHVGDRVLVRVEVEQLQNQGVRFAEVELPAGVYFYSERYPELKEKRSVVLAWNDQMDVSNLPVVIQGQATGSKQIKIRFQDSEHRTVKERQVTIRFSA